MKTLLVNEFKTQFKLLVEQPRGLCISIYMPNYSKRVQLQQNLRFRNLLRQAEELLSANGRSSTVALKLLQPASALLYDKAFWQYQDKGLAVFIAKEVFYYYRLPLIVEELVVMADHFYLDPLLKLIH